MLLGVDIGGTAVKLGLMDVAGRIHARAEHRVDFDSYQTPILETALGRAGDFLQEYRVELAGIGISATGQINSKLGIVAGTCGSLPGWEGAPLTEAFEQAFRRPAVAMNDANCALLGECWKGGAQGCQNVVMVTLGTGVGGGIMADGRILQGSFGLGGELGHMPLLHGSQPCTCGNTGCYEQYASVTALLRRAKNQLGLDLEGAKPLFDRAQAGNEGVAALLDAWQEDIAAGLVGLTHLFNPELILLGGGVSRQQELLVQPLREKILCRCMPRFTQGLRVEAAVLGNDAGMMGAVRSWLDAHPQ